MTDDEVRAHFAELRAHFAAVSGRLDALQAEGESKGHFWILLLLIAIALKVGAC